MIDLDIVSGFLGSGKTTLIKKYLEAYKNEKIVVIENEFGKIGIDKDIIKKDGLEIIELQNGCICCSMKLNFKDTILKVINDFNPERIIIEPTGVAMLNEIVSMVSSEEIKANCKISSLITVLDAINYFDYIDSFGEFFEDQILNANLILLSKTKNLKQNEINNITNSLKQLDKNLNILIEDWDKISIKNLKNECNLNSLKYKNKENKYESIDLSMNEISTISFSDFKIKDVEKLKELFDNFKNKEYGEIIRAKGFFKTLSGNVLEFNYVNGILDICNSDVDTNSKMCIIGKKLEKEKLIKILNKVRIRGRYKA
ncbi:GTP-binding protein [Romboutsia lituseburensis]|uniref:GTP-binding protein n=1 Tax=Romboutsia lituseburensis TaxID=1537 RepID=UPI00215A3125|nr:GTP-binding protein [Romboutsia lituseburensis]MCR8745129.1 GTP-binding protein [Romboutsia lituseburensis]